MQPKIVVIGSANTDMVVKLTHLPAVGETVLGGEFIIAQGGKGANQAVAAARLGAHVTFVARLGCDSFGEASFAAYQAEGIDTGYLVWDETTPSGTALIMVNAQAENIIAVASGANFKLSPADVRVAEPAIKAADCVLLQLEIPLETVAASIELACQHGVRVLLNPAPATTYQLPLALLKKVDTLTPNETELQALMAPISLQKPSASIHDLAATFLASSGVENLVVTLGKRGALIAGSQGSLLPAFCVQAVDTTGAGDAFNGGLAVALARGDPLTEAVRYASATAALSTTRMGAQLSLPTADEVETFLQK